MYQICPNHKELEARSQEGRSLSSKCNLRGTAHTEAGKVYPFLLALDSVSSVSLPYLQKSKGLCVQDLSNTKQISTPVILK